MQEQEKLTIEDALRQIDQLVNQLADQGTRIENIYYWFNDMSGIGSQSYRIESREVKIR